MHIVLRSVMWARRTLRECVRYKMCDDMWMMCKANIEEDRCAQSSEHDREWGSMYEYWVCTRQWGIVCNLKCAMICDIHIVKCVQCANIEENWCVQSCEHDGHWKSMSMSNKGVYSSYTNTYMYYIHCVYIYIRTHSVYNTYTQCIHMMSMGQTMRECVRRLPTVGFYLHLANCLLSTYITIKSIIRTNEHHTRSIWIDRDCGTMSD